MKASRILLTLGALAASSGLWAHAVWVEKEKGVAKAYFGEWNEDKREVAGKLLDYIKGPQAFVGQDKTPIAMTKETNHFAAPVKGAGDIRVIEASLKVATSKATGIKTKGYYIAKYGRTETAAVGELELVPEAPGSNTFTLVLRGKPVPQAAVEVVGPPRWNKAFTTNDQGKVTIETPWAGPYLLEAVHIVKTPGTAGGEAFDQERFVTTVFFETSQGIRWKK